MIDGLPRPNYAVRTLGAVFLAAYAWVAAAHHPAHGLNLTEFDRPFAAPDFSLPMLTGGESKLSGYEGQVVLLNFWATWCPPCLEEMPSMEALYQSHKNDGFVVVAVSSDREGAGIVKGFADKAGITFPILLDATGGISASYGAKNLPVSFLLDREGRIVAGSQGARDWDSQEAREFVNGLLGAS